MILERFMVVLMSSGGCGWDVGGCGWVWLVLDWFKWVWMILGGCGCIWMSVDGFGWI